MNFRPLHDRVMVKRETEEDVTKGGIIIPDTAKEKPMHAKIVAVGSGHKAEDGTITPLDVKKGDKVLIGKWSGTEVTIADIDYVIVKESDIMGIVS
jgi:chaperonin GroES